MDEDELAPAPLRRRFKCSENHRRSFTHAGPNLLAFGNPLRRRRNRAFPPTP